MSIIYLYIKIKTVLVINCLFASIKLTNNKHIKRL